MTMFHVCKIALLKNPEILYLKSFDKVDSFRNMFTYP